MNYYEPAEAAGISEDLRQEIRFGSEGKLIIGQAIILEVRTLKERRQLTAIPIYRAQ